MLNNILKAEGAQALTKVDQKEINGGAGVSSGVQSHVFLLMLGRAKNAWWLAYNAYRSVRASEAASIMHANFMVMQHHGGRGMLQLLRSWRLIK
jgi:hypothetical protein